MLRLPYIPARDYQQWFKEKLGIEVDKKTCRQVAKRARLIEQKVLGKPDVEFLKTLHRLPSPQSRLRAVPGGDKASSRDTALSGDKREIRLPEIQGTRRDAK